MGAPQQLELRRCWLFLFYRPFGRVFHPISGRLPESDERNDRGEKNVQTTPSALSASAVCTWPTIIQISRTPQHWKFTQHLRTTHSASQKNTLKLKNITVAEKEKNKNIDLLKIIASHSLMWHCQNTWRRYGLIKKLYLEREPLFRNLRLTD